jgi:hypothetical protein
MFALSIVNRRSLWNISIFAALISLCSIRTPLFPFPFHHDSVSKLRQEGYTALMRALVGYQAEVVDRLVEARANVDVHENSEVRHKID